MIRIGGVRAILTDIEGTTGSIAFVHDTLFPYARAHMASFVLSRPDEARPLLDQVRAAPGEPDQAVVQRLLGWMDEDRKATPLKTLQGLIWREGYRSGALVGHVYDDAVRGLRRWHAAGLKLYVYSSGSVEAQTLLFGHSLAGDLTPLFSGYFDTAVGAKGEADAYARIAAAIGAAPAAILFLSDSPAEIAAAHSAGLKAVRLLRDASPGPGEAGSFDDIEIG